MKMIIKDTNGEIREVEVTADINIDVQPGQQLFFTGATSSDVSISGDNTDVRLSLVDENGETISIGMPGLAEQISSNDPTDPFSLTTALGVSTTREGDAEIEKLVNDPELEVGEMIDQLKEALAQSNSADKDGVLIDDFGALMDISESSAANTDQLSSEQFDTAANNTQNIKPTKERASRPEEDESDDEDDEEDDDEDDTDVVADTVYGDDLNADGIINESEIDILDESGDEIINQTESLNTTITGNIGEGGETLDSVVIVDDQGNELNIDVTNVKIEDDGSYSINDVDLSTLSDGTLTITSNSTDLDGLKAINTDTINKDTVFGDNADGTDEGVTADIIDESDSGSSQTDDLTNDATPTITGITDANSEVVITNEAGVVVGTATSDDQGNYSITTVELADGSQDLTITATDTTGNVTSTTQSIEVDTDTTNSIDITDESGDNIINASEVETSDIAGNVEAGSTIDELTITDGINTVTVNPSDITLNADGSYTIDNVDLSILNDGELTTTVTSTDIAGNQTSSEDIISKDTVFGDNENGIDEGITADLIDASDSGTSVTDNLTNDTTPTITGITDANSEVVITNEAGEVVGSTTADANGNYSITTTELSEGEQDLTITATDTAGNVTSTLQSIEIDTQIDAPSITDMVDTNGDMSEIIASGTGNEAGNVINLYDQNGNVVISTEVQEDGTWSVDIASLSNDTDFTITATETDTAGNESVASNEVNTYQSDSTTTNSYASDDFIFTGSGDDSIRVEKDDDNDKLVVDGGEGIDTIKFSGNDGMNVNLEDGTATVGDDNIELRNIENVYGSNGGDDTIVGSSEDNKIYGQAGDDVIDAGAGDDYIHGGSGDDTFVYNIGDGSDTIYDSSGSNNIQFGDGITADDLTFSRSSVGEDNSRHLTIQIGNNPEDTITLKYQMDDNEVRDDRGVEDITFADGTTITVETLLETYGLTVTDDGEDTINIHASAGDDTINAGAGNDAMDAGAGDDTITGGAGDDYIVGNAGTDTAVYSGNIDDYTVVKDINGFITITDNRDGSPDGTDTLDSIEFIQFSDMTVTTATPDAPTVDLVESSDSGKSNVDNNTSDTTPTFTVSLGAGLSVGYIVTLSTGESHTLTQEDITNGSVDITTEELSDDTYEITATISSLLDFESGDSNEVVTVIDTDTTNSIDITDESGDNIINASEVETSDIAGNVEAGSTIDELTITDGINTVTVNPSDITLNADGSYTIDNVDLSTLNDGELTTTVTSTDIAGNQTSSEDIISKDTVFGDNENGIDEGITADLIDASDSGTSVTDNLTNDTTPTITGITDANSEVVITNEAGEVVGSTTADANGNYSITTTELSEGEQDLTITATDTAGNVTSTLQSIEIDTSVSSFSIDTLVSNEGEDTASLTGNTEPNAEVELTLTDSNGTEVTVTVSADENGDYEATFGTDGLSDGDYTISGTSTDSAGNSESTEVTGDNLNTFQDAISSDIVDSSDTGISITDDLTKDSTPTITGNTEPNVQVTITNEEGTVVGTDTSDDNGDYSITTSELSDGPQKLTITATDSAGNETSIDQDIVVDTTLNTEADSNTLVEDAQSTVTGNVLSNDDNDITITAETITGTYGSVEIASDGSYTYTVNDSAQSLEENEVVSDPFTYTVTDDAGNITTETLTINITGTNDAPIVNTVDLGSFDEDHSLTITPEQLLANSTDMDGDDLSISSVTVDPSIGTITQDGDNYIFTPNENFNGDDISLSFSVTDGIETINSTATVDVTAVNDGPVLEGDSNVSFVEGDNGVIVNDNITITDIDDDNIDGAIITIGTNYVASEDSLNFTSQNGISGTFNAQTGELTLTGSATKEEYEEALESVTYTNSSNEPDLEVRDITFTVTDGEGTSATINSSVNISAVNDAPVISVDNYEVDKDEGSLAITLSASDVDSDIDSFTLTTLPDNGTLYLDSELTQEISANTPISSDGTTQVYFQPDYGDDENANSFGEEWFDTNSISFDFFATDNGSQDLDAVNSQSATINIVVDDVPFVYGETTQIIDENDIGSDANFASGNVLSNDYLGDDSSGASVHEVTFTAGGETGTAIVGETTSTGYGDLTIEADGTWNFTPDSDLDQTSGDLNFSFSYNVIDGDGDISETKATQTITIQDGNELTIGTPDSSQVVDESNLLDGSDTNTNALSVSGSLAISTGSDSIDVKFDTSMGTDANYSAEVEIEPEVNVSLSIGPVIENNTSSGSGLSVDTVTDLDDISASDATTSVNGHSYNDISLSSSDDIVDITGTATEKISLGNGDNQLQVGQSTYKEVSSGSGDDQIDIDSHTYKDIDTGAGDDIVNIGGTVTSSSDIDLGNGDNQLSANRTLSDISAGAGDDIVNIGSHSEGTIDLGAGDNQIEVANSAKGIITGSGTDTVIIGTNQISEDVDLGAGDDKLAIGGYATGDIDLGAGNDIAQIGGEANGDIDLGSGDNQIQIGGHARGDIAAGSGDDIVNIEGAATSEIDLGAGDNKLQIDERAYDDISSGSGADQIDIATHLDGDLDTGAGDDIVNIGGTVTSTSEIELGSGDDQISIGEVIQGSVDGGSGNDTISLDMDKTTFDNHYASKVTNFETIILNDGTYDSDGNKISDATVTDLDDIADIDWSSTTVSSYEYPLTLTSDGETTTTINNLPSGITATDSEGNELTIVDGSIEIELSNGETNIILESNESVDLSSVTTIQSTENETEIIDDSTALTHEGTPITYEYSEDGHTLRGVAGDTDIFTVELTNASTSSDDAGYTFTLLDSIDHHDGNLTLDELNIPFNIIATDTEGDSVSGSFSIKVLDDEPIETNGYVINEDGDVSFNISADRVSSVTFDGVEHGTATYDETTGQITYTPDEDFSGYEDFTYTTTDADGDSVTATITVDVKPIVENDTEAINEVATGEEDTWIDLDIETPSVNDADSETITEVRLENLPNGSELQYSDGTSITITGGSAVVDLDKVDDIQVKAPSDSGDDFDITTKIVVTDTATLSDDSDVSNTQTFTGKIEVEVEAIADDTSITSQDATATEQGLEANEFSLNDLISDVSFGDTTDGSETHTITIENLPEGTIVSNGSATVSENVDGTINITVESDNLNGVKLQFTDTAEGDYEVSMTSTATESEGSVATSDTVTATLHVNPSAGEVEFDTQTVSGLEDSVIALNIDVTNENPDSDGSESVTGIEISGIPAGATILDSEGNVLFESTEDGSSILLPMDASDIEGLQIQAGENDSSSFNLEVKIESTDGSVVGLSEAKEIMVNVDADVDNSITADNITGLEDTAIPFNVSYTDLDDSEVGSVELSNAPVGTTITYGDPIQTVVISSEDQKVVLDVEDAESLALTPPHDFSGTINVEMTTTIIDTEGLSADIKTISSDFQVNVTGDADTPILTVSGASGEEDSAIDLNIGAALRDTDGSESLSVTIEGIPDGAVLSAGTQNIDGTWSLTADQLENLTVTPSEDSNENFDLTITATSKENDATGDTASTTLFLPVIVTGVADAATISASGSGLEDNHISLDLNAVNEDSDSETLTYMISDVPSDVTLYRVDDEGNAITIDNDEYARIGEFGGFSDTGGTNWIISGDDLDNIRMIPQDDFSGTVSMNFAVTSTENDGDMNTVTVPLNVEVNPDLDTNLTDTSISGTEDNWMDLNLSNTGADSEVISNVSIDSLPDGASALGVNVDGNYEILTPNDDGSYDITPEQISAGVAVLPDTNSDENFDLTITRTVTDASDDGTNLTADAQTVTSTINVNVIGDSDSLDSIIIDDDVTLDASNEIGVDSIISDIQHADADGSESQYFVIQNEDGADNTSWIVTGDGVINAGDGTFIVTNIDTANIQVIDTTSGDGSVNVTITPFVVEREGDVLEDTANIQTTSINYTVGGEFTEPTTPTLDISQNEVSGDEDQNITDDLLNVNSNGDVSYRIEDTQNGSISGNDLYSSDDGSHCNVDGLFLLPDGTFVTTDLDSIVVNPTEDFSGEVTLDVKVIASTDEGAENISSEELSISIDTATDGFKIETDAVGDEDTEIDLNIVLNQIDNDGSESIVGDTVTISILQSVKDENGDNQFETTTSNGEINYTGSDTFIDNGDGTYTVSRDALDDITFKGEDNIHGSVNLQIDFQAQDGDASIIDQSKIFTVKVNSVVDDISLDVADNNLDSTEGVSSINLGLTSNLSDDDGSEVGYIQIDGVPNGATLSHGFGQVNDDGSSSWLVPQSVAGIVALVPETHFSSDTFTLDVVAKVYDVDSGTFNVSASSENINVTIDPVASEVSVQASTAQGSEDSSINLNLNISMDDIDGSETLNIDLKDIPEGSIIELNGTEYSPDENGVVTLTGVTLEDSQNITFTAPENTYGNFELAMDVKTVDTAGNITSTLETAQSATVNVEVQAIASDFETGSEITVDIGDPQATINGVEVPVSLTGIVLNDTDGSETLTITIEGLGESANVTYVVAGNTLTATINDDGTFSFELDPSDTNYEDVLESIKFTAEDANDLEGDISFNATATEVSTGESHTLTNTITVDGFVSDAEIIETNTTAIDSVGDAIQLNLELPNSLDNNEKLGSITLNIQGDMKLTNENDDVISESLSSGVSIVIINSDGSVNENIHPADQSTENAITMTEDEFNNLQVVSDSDITGTVTVDTTYDAFEVDNSNNTIDGIDPVTTTHSEVIDVDDTITYDENSTIDAGVGFDTLEIDHDDIDLSELADSITNLEVIDMDNDIDQTINVDLDSIIDMTDDNHDLVFVGDDGDVLDFGVEEEWTKSETTTTVEGEEGNFVEYESTTNSNVTVFVHEEVDVITTDF